MPRGVAKAKDGNVGKNDKGDGKVVVGKRGRKMRGGGENFKQYCEKFVLDHNNEKKKADDNILKMFKTLKTIIPKLKFVYQGSIFTTNTDNADRRRAIPIIDKIIGASKIDDINQDNLKFILKFINTHIEIIIDEFEKEKEKVKQDAEEQDTEEQDTEEQPTINKLTIRTLFKNILFLKIYKLFKEFEDISSDITTIYNIEIEKAGDKGKEHTNMLKDNPNIPTTSLELGWPNDVSTGSLQQADQTAADPRQQRKPFLLLTTDADPVNKGSNRSGTNKRSSIYVSKSKHALQIEDKEQPTKVLDDTKDKQEKAALTEPKFLQQQSRTETFTDDESEDEFEVAKTDLMILIKDDTKQAEDDTTYKKYEKIRDGLDEDKDNENEMYLKDALNNLLFKKINTIQDILGKRSNSIQKIKEIETFLSSVTDEKIIKEAETYVRVIFQFEGIDSHKKDEWSRMINEVGDEFIRLFSIFRPEIIKYIELLKTQKGQDDLKRPQPESTDGSKIQQDPSTPHLLEKHNPLNVSRNSSALLPPIQSDDSELSSQLEKFRINDKNEKKIKTAKLLKKFYILFIKIIENELLTNPSIYYTKNQYMESVKQHFDYIIEKAFEILNFDAITNVEKELNLLKKYPQDYTSKMFYKMRTDVKEHYGDDMTSYTLKTKALKIIALLENNLNDFNFKCYDLLTILFENSKNIWKGGGQPRKSQRKEHINNTEAMKKKLTTKDPKANEPTAKEPTKTPKAKEPTKTPKANEPTTKEPTKTPKAKNPTKDPKAKEPTAKEPTKTPKQNEPTKTPKAKEPKPTKTPKQNEPTKTPKAKEPKPHKPTKK